MSWIKKKYDKFIFKKDRRTERKEAVDKEYHKELKKAEVKQAGVRAREKAQQPPMRKRILKGTKKFLKKVPAGNGSIFYGGSVRSATRTSSSPRRRRRRKKGKARRPPARRPPARRKSSYPKPPTSYQDQRSYFDL